MKKRVICSLMNKNNINETKEVYRISYSTQGSSHEKNGIKHFRSLLDTVLELETLAFKNC